MDDIFYTVSKKQTQFLLNKNIISDCLRCEHYFYESDLTFCRSCKNYLLVED